MKKVKDRTSSGLSDVVDRRETRDQELSNLRQYALTERVSRTSFDFEFDLERRYFNNKNLRVKIRCGRDRKPAELAEEPNFVAFKTPKLLAEAVITLPPLTSNRTYDIGWVQACSFLKFCNRYNGYGFTSWEFPQLNEGGNAVNDSSGKFFPFYGHRYEVQSITGPTTKTKEFVVAMSDAPMSKVTFKIPCQHVETGKICDLTGIERRQQFFLWLVAKSRDSGRVYPLRTIVWEVDLQIGVNPNAPLGRMATLLSPKTQKKPRVLETVAEVPPEALGPPPANEAQMLLWRPLDKRGHVSIIVMPSLKKPPTKNQMENSIVYESGI